MGKIIAVINQKGGVGKTATTCNLAYCFAERMKKTLLIDMDSSANATNIYTQTEPDLTLKDFLMDKERGKDALTVATIKNVGIPFLSLLPSHISIALTAREISHKPYREALLAKKLEATGMLDFFDHIFLDCPPNLNDLTINAMFCADFILVPVTYEKHALEGVADLFSLLSEIKEGHSYDLKIIRNKFDARKKTANNFVSEKLSDLDEQGLVLKTVIRQDEEVNKATIENQPVITFSPKTGATLDYQNLTAELGGLFNG